MFMVRGMMDLLITLKWVAYLVFIEEWVFALD